MEIEICIILLIRAIIGSTVNDDKIFDQKVDGAINSILKNVYQGKYKHIFNTDNTTPMKRTTTTIKPMIATKILITQRVRDTMTVEEFFIRKRLQDIELLLGKDTKMPIFDPKIDEFNIQTRRFDAIESKPQDEYLRELYHYFEDGDYIGIQKNRTVSLMQQFVYETRYNLPYAQLLRKKYLHNIRYQIGYCFALLRNLKQQQMIIYSTLKSNYKVMMHLLIHLKLYEKVIRLDVDVMDLVRYIKQLHSKYEENKAQAKKNRKES